MPFEDNCVNYMIDIESVDLVYYFIMNDDIGDRREGGIVSKVVSNLLSCMLFKIVATDLKTFVVVVAVAVVVVAEGDYCNNVLLNVFSYYFER